MNSDSIFNDEEILADHDIVLAYKQYAHAGLRIPPVPREMVKALTRQADWFYATAHCQLDDRAAFLAAAEVDDPQPFVAFGHVGHGVASWHLCYQLLDGPLAVFMRLRYGSPYGDNEPARDMANRITELIEELVVQVDEASLVGQLAPATRLLLIIDQISESGWQILGENSPWYSSKTPFYDVRKKFKIR